MKKENNSLERHILVKAVFNQVVFRGKPIAHTSTIRKRNKDIIDYCNNYLRIDKKIKNKIIAQYAQYTGDTSFYLESFQNPANDLALICMVTAILERNYPENWNKLIKDIFSEDFLKKMLSHFDELEKKEEDLDEKEKAIETQEKDLLKESQKTWWKFWK